VLFVNGFNTPKVSQSERKAKATEQC